MVGLRNGEGEWVENPKRLTLTRPTEGGQHLILLDYVVTFSMLPLFGGKRSPSTSPARTRHDGADDAAAAAAVAILFR